MVARPATVEIAAVVLPVIQQFSTTTTEVSSVTPIAATALAAGVPSTLTMVFLTVTLETASSSLPVRITDAPAFAPSAFDTNTQSSITTLRVVPAPVLRALTAQ